MPIYIYIYLHGIYVGKAGGTNLLKKKVGGTNLVFRFVGKVARVLVLVKVVLDLTSSLLSDREISNFTKLLIWGKGIELHYST